MEHYDVIVIGSGAGDGTVAHALAPTGKRVLILERGGYLPREIENWSSKAVWGDGRYHNSGQWLDATTGEEFAPKQHNYVGGNTKFYGSDRSYPTATPCAASQAARASGVVGSKSGLMRRVDLAQVVQSCSGEGRPQNQ